MARVLRGKIAISGDHMEASFQVLAQFEHEKKPLRKRLEQCTHDFAQTLAWQYTPKTVRTHEQILALFIALLQTTIN
jgi:hypothetical protein